MNKTEAKALAVMRWGINAFAVRANDITPGTRYRVGFLAGQDGQTVVKILGMGRSWDEAFSIATQHPENEAQQQKASRLREQFQQKKAELTSREAKP